MWLSAMRYLAKKGNKKDMEDFVEETVFKKEIKMKNDNQKIANEKGAEITKAIMKYDEVCIDIKNIAEYLYNTIKKNKLNEKDLCSVLNIQRCNVHFSYSPDVSISRLELTLHDCYIKAHDVVGYIIIPIAYIANRKILEDKVNDFTNKYVNDKRTKAEETIKNIANVVNTTLKEKVKIFVNALKDLGISNVQIIYKIKKFLLSLEEKEEIISSDVTTDYITVVYKHNKKSKTLKTFTIVDYLEGDIH